MSDQTPIRLRALTGEARELYESWRRLGHSEDDALDEVRDSGILDEELTKWRPVPGPDGLHLSVKVEYDRYGRAVVTGLAIEGRPIRADDLRKIRLSELEAVPLGGAIEQQLTELPPLRRTPGMQPEEFSRLVAEHFRCWARLSLHPAAAMAAKHGVKLPTMHTWIREARLRGYLPPAARGKSGPAS